MGDFAAGKMLLNGAVEVARVEPDNFDQFVTDMDAFDEFAKSVEDVHPAPAPDANVLASAITPGTPSEMLLCLKQWRDLGVSLFVGGVSYTIMSADDIAANRAASAQDAYVIGKDLDDAYLQMAQSNGELFDNEGTSLGTDLGQELGFLRHYAVSHHIEWCDGWIEKM